MFRVAIAALVLTFATPIAMGAGTPFSIGMESLVRDDKILRNDSPIQTFHTGVDAKNSQTIVYWPENRQLYVFPELELDDPHWTKPVLLWIDVIDLETGVVATTEGIGTSTYLRTAEEVTRLVQIASDGTTFIVRKI